MKSQRGGTCITREEVANIVQEIYPDADLEDDMGFSDIIEGTLFGKDADPDCFTFDEVATIVELIIARFQGASPPPTLARNTLQAHILPPIIKKQNEMRTIKRLGKKKKLPAQINSVLASYITGLPGNINSQLAQLNEERQRFGERLAPRRNTRRRSSKSSLKKRR